MHKVEIITKGKVTMLDMFFGIILLYHLLAAKIDRNSLKMVEMDLSPKKTINDISCMFFFKYLDAVFEAAIGLWRLPTSKTSHFLPRT